MQLAQHNADRYRHAEWAEAYVLAKEQCQHAETCNKQLMAAVHAKSTACEELSARGMCVLVVMLYAVVIIYMDVILFSYWND